VTDNLPWKFHCGLMERFAVAVRYADRFAALIDYNCLPKDRPEVAVKKMVQVPRDPTTFKGYSITNGKNPFTV